MPNWLNDRFGCKLAIVYFVNKLQKKLNIFKKTLLGFFVNFSRTIINLIQVVKIKNDFERTLTKNGEGLLLQTQTLHIHDILAPLPAFY